MLKRGNESPMDFEWQSQTPMDTTSPYYKLAMSQQKAQNDLKRSRSVFDSPQKASTPALREPNSQPFLFSQPPGLKPAPVFGNPAFTTPRKPTDIDFSSGPENASSPEHADAEDTPDQKPQVTQFISNTGAGNKVASRPKRNSLWGIYGRFAPSPKESGMSRGGPHSNALVRKVQKRRRKAEKFEHGLAFDRRPSQESDDEPDDGANPHPKPPHEMATVNTFPVPTFFERHAATPYHLSKWVQLGVTMALNSIIVFGAYLIFSGIRADLRRAIDEAASGTLKEMQACSKSYIENNCAPHLRAPALEDLCSNWELCMNRDPDNVKRSHLSARLLAETFNSFFDQLSIKTSIFIVVLVISGILSTRSTWTSFNNSGQIHPDPIPPTSRHPSQQYDFSQQQQPIPPSGYGQPEMGWNGGGPRGGGYTGNDWKSPGNDGYWRSGSPTRHRSRSPQKRLHFS